MYFSTLKNKIGSVEEKKFYDICIMYLNRLGYKDINIIDGTGDGGRDVTCSREDLRIQLSVRRDWENKINEEAEATLAKNKRHLIYITNKDITIGAEQKFFDDKYNHKGEVDISIHSLRKIATALAQPGVIKKAYEMLGDSIPKELEATPKEIAISTVLLFSNEAKELRESIIEANIKAFIYKNPGQTSSEVTHKVSESIPGSNIERNVQKSLNKLRSAKEIRGKDLLHLSSEVIDQIKASETEFKASFKSDINLIKEELNLNDAESKKLLESAMELLIRRSDLDGIGPHEESLRNVIAELDLNRRKKKTYDILSKTTSAKIKQYGKTIDHIFSTNTFDIYRALGRRSELIMVLDSSVAMPVMFGLEFGGARSRYGLAALALKNTCKDHNIRMVVPHCYINEAASHGLRALNHLDIYNALETSIQESFKASENAYLSHYTHIKETLQKSGNPLSPEDFLKHFSIYPGQPTEKIENRIRSILDMHGIREIPDVRFDKTVRESIKEKKPNGTPILIDHDASVCTMLRDDDEHGYIFATWDKSIVEIVENITRILVDTPARIIDFLSLSSSQDFECDHSYELLTSLLYVDEKPAQQLSEKLEEIQSVEQAYQFNQYIHEARSLHGDEWSPHAEDVGRFLEDSETHSQQDTRDTL